MDDKASQVLMVDSRWPCIDVHYNLWTQLHVENMGKKSVLAKKTRYKSIGDFLKKF